VQTIRAILILAMVVAPGVSFQEAAPNLARQARTELFAARYDRAIDLYRKALVGEQAGDSYYGLTRALLRAHRSKEAYTAANDALSRTAQSPGAQTAAGLAAFRKGEVTRAEDYFREALKLDSNYAGALSGLAAIHSAISNHNTARNLLKQAYSASPEDPILALSHVNMLKGEEHIAGLEHVLATIDPESEEARNLRVHIASDRALRGRTVRRLVSPYESARLKLIPIMASPQRLRGYGLRVQFNQRQAATLLLDTGASGISLSPKTAEKAGLELLSDEASEAKGIGDKKPQDRFSYLASEVRIGSVVFGDHPVSAFRSAKDSEIDGLIGADVFQRFLVSLDFPALQVSLEPFSGRTTEEPGDATVMPDGFHRVLRAGDHLMIATSVNGSAAKWFLIDSGSFSNLIDTESARDFTGVRQDAFTGVRGVQGKVDQVSRADRITLVFGGFRQENPNLIAIDLEKTSDSSGFEITGVLGMPVLSQLKAMIDYHSGAVRFDRHK
jgi:tetratricopeptide (TPR) repeat protein